MDEDDILYQRGDYWVRKRTAGYEVYRDGPAHAVRVASIGYTGAKGLTRAKAEVDARFAYAHERIPPPEVKVQIKALINKYHVREGSTNHRLVALLRELSTLASRIQ